MKLSWQELLAGAALLCAVAAQNSSSGGLSSSDLLTILAKLPICVTKCSLNVLAAANCEVVDIRSCLCTNNTMQHVLAICVLDSCNITEQAIATTVAQKDICEGIPQPSRSGEIIQCVVAISIITFPIIILRLLSRCLISRSLWWDDWLVVLCSLLLVPMAVFPILNATKGFGKHFYTIPPENIPLLREIYYVSQIFYAIVHPVAKISILLLYLRIFPDITFQRVTKISIVWMIIHLVAFFFAVTFQCVPVKSIWDTSIPGRCTNLVAVIYSGAILSIIEDVIIILLPISQLRGLKTTLRKKLALIFMFTLGSFACITSMIRLKYIVQFNSDVDLTWADVDMTIWSIIEVYSAVICVCLLSIRPLLSQYFPKLFPGSQPSSKSSRPPWDPSPRLNCRLTGTEQNSSRSATLLGGDETPRDTEMNMTKNSMMETEHNIELTPTSPPSFTK